MGRKEARVRRPPQLPLSTAVVVLWGGMATGTGGGAGGGGLGGGGQGTGGGIPHIANPPLKGARRGGGRMLTERRMGTLRLETRTQKIFKKLSQIPRKFPKKSHAQQALLDARPAHPRQDPAGKCLWWWYTW